MKTGFRSEEDGWSTEGANIASPENLSQIRDVLEHTGPIIVEWWHYRGSSAPDRLVFDDYDEFIGWLALTMAGDAVWVWDFAALCREDNAIAHGKSPDEGGQVPIGGAY